MPAPPTRPPRLLIVILLAAFAAYLGWALYYSVTDILSYDDFEVFHYIGGVAAGHSSNIYELVTPHQQRGPFLYPPSAAVLFVPLSWLSHNVAGVLFSIVKVGCLLLLWIGSARFSGRPPRDLLGMLLVMFGTAAMLHRPVSSEVGNGQINIILAAAAVGGVWLMMRSRQWWGWGTGALLLAWAIAIKMTPALLLAVPLLNGKWKAFGTSAAAALALTLLLPMVWFGQDGYQKMSRQYRDVAARFTFDWPAPEEQTTPTELFQFARLQSGAAKAGAANTPDVLSVPISGWAGERLLEPAYRAPAMRAWLLVGLFSAAAFLAVRMVLFRRRDASADVAAPAGSDWTWDLAMLCALIVLLSPRVQKAHLVILVVPAAWIGARLCAWFAPESDHDDRRRGAWGVVGYVLLCVLFIIADSLRIPIPSWPEPARFLPLVGLLLMVGMLIAIERVDVRRGMLATT